MLCFKMYILNKSDLIVFSILKILLGCFAEKILVLQERCNRYQVQRNGIYVCKVVYFMFQKHWQFLKFL